MVLNTESNIIITNEYHTALIKLVQKIKSTTVKEAHHFLLKIAESLKSSDCNIHSESSKPVRYFKFAKTTPMVFEIGSFTFIVDGNRTWLFDHISSCSQDNVVAVVLSEDAVLMLLKYKQFYSRKG